MIEQTAEGGSVVQKNVTFTILICTESNHVINVNSAPISILKYIWDEHDVLRSVNYFDSSDDFCEPINYSLVTSNDGSDLPIDADAMTNIMVVDLLANDLRTFEAEIHFAPEVVARQTVFIRAETVAGVVAYKEAFFDVRCGPNSNIVSRNQNSVYQVNVLKNEGVVTAISSSDVEGFFSVEDNRCPILEYQIEHPLGGALNNASLSALLSGSIQLDNSIKFNTDINPQDSKTVYIPHEFSIKAIANGTASINKRVELRVVVCGYEVITPTVSSIR
jgi:hypothetical protein